MKNRKAVFILLLLVCICTNLSARKFYVDPLATGTPEDGLSETKAYRSINSVNGIMWQFGSGDTICFKRGEMFYGSLNIYRSGSNAAPLVFTTYGTSSIPPIFLYQGSASVESRNVIVIANSSYVVIDGIKIVDTTMHHTNHDLTANVARGVYIYTGTSGGALSRYNVIKNLDISKIGIGITVDGNDNSILNNTIHNLREIVKTASPTWDDFGAVGILIEGGSNNKIYNNYMRDCWATSPDWGHDGGAMELWGAASDNEILYNTAIENDGWIQQNAGYGSAARSANNNIIAYNLLINNGRIFWFNLSSTLTVTNLQFYNNNVIETKVHLSRYPYLIGLDKATAPANMLNIKNNIFYVVSVDNTFTPARPITLTFTSPPPFASGQVHENNLYYIPAGASAIGYTLNANESLLSTNANLFTSFSNADPTLWDYTLPLTSPAFDFGQVISTLTKDYISNPVPRGVSTDAGILELFLSVLKNVSIDLSAVKKDGYNSLTCKIAPADLPFDYFEIQSSADNKNFTLLTKIGRDSLNKNQTYMFDDYSIGAHSGIYYRIVLKMGDATYFSKVVHLEKSLQNFVTRIFPNPTSNTLTVAFEKLHNLKALYLYSIDGNLKRKTILGGKFKKLSISLADLKEGMYYLMIHDNEDRVICKEEIIVKSN